MTSSVHLTDIKRTVWDIQYTFQVAVDSMDLTLRDGVGVSGSLDIKVIVDNTKNNNNNNNNKGTRIRRCTSIILSYHGCARRLVERDRD